LFSFLKTTDARRREKHFFATRADLEPGVRLIEGRHRLVFVESDMVPTPELHMYSSLLDIPALGTNETGSHTTGKCVLVMKSGAKPSLRRIPQRKGGVMYSADQDNNPNSIVLWPGGVYRNEALICGHVGTISTRADSVDLWGEFHGALLKGFTKIKSYHVGPEALRLYDAGWRLVTIGVKSSVEYDLRRD
jgi:hypothetical protein